MVDVEHVLWTFGTNKSQSRWDSSTWVPHVFSDIERLAERISRMTSISKTFTSCWSLKHKWYVFLVGVLFLRVETNCYTTLIEHVPLKRLETAVRLQDPSASVLFTPWSHFSICASSAFLGLASKGQLQIYS